MKANGNINAPQVIAWFRSKASEFNGIADSLEKTFNSDGAVSSPGVLAPSNRTVTIQDVQKVVGNRTIRAATIAAELNTSRENIQTLLEEHAGAFDMIGKGWMKLKT